jgi:serine protease
MNTSLNQKLYPIRFYRGYLQTLFKITNLLFIFSMALSLVACGGSSKSYSVGGTVTGLQGSVTLRNNTENVTLNSSGDFSFNDQLDNGSNYNVTVETQPANQVCIVTNGSGTISKANVTNVSVSCTEGATLSGSFQAAPLIQVDSDVNDAGAAVNVSNGNSNDFSGAQTIPNFSTVHGFATKLGTGRISDGDRFASSSDEIDVYRVNLQANQTIRLQVVDFFGEDVFTGDLDLLLYDLSSNLLDFSDGVDEFENITVTADGDYYIVVNAFKGSSKYTLSLNSVSPANVSHQSADFIPGEAIIKFKKNAAISNNMGANRFTVNNEQMLLSHTKTTRATLAKFDVSDNNNVSSLSTVKTKPGFLAELKQRNFNSYQKIKTLRQIKELNQRADVEYAEPNYIYKPLLVPDDEFYNLQWHYPAINLPHAWDITTGDRVGGGDVIVAVVDTGVFLAHPELAGQLVSGYDFISDPANAADGDGVDNNPDDPGDGAQLSSSSWHGTHVAGTIAAATNNGNGVAGVAWGAKIMPLRALGTEGGSSFDVMQAVLYAAGLDNSSNTLPTQKADIINLSLGGGGSSVAAQAAFTAARAAGVIIVAAAGNENTSQLSYPASYDGVISVSATDFANNRAPYSNFGTEIDIAAPGGSQGVDLNNDGFGDGVLSTLVDDSSGSREPTLKFYQGTSMAAPHVAGVFALMRAVHSSITPDEIDTLLASGTITTDLGSVGRDDIYGHGLIDALKAVQEAQKLANGGTLPNQPALIVSNPNTLTLGGTSSAFLKLTNEGDDPASITSVDVSASWMVVDESKADVTNGLGDYPISINRVGLNDSFYFGTITFNLSTSASVQVQVSMTVGSVDAEGKAGTIYMLLIDSDNEVADQVSVVEAGNGMYDYSFAHVVPGSYRVIGGSDIDNDVFICQLGEACGGYPIINALSDIEVSDDDITGLDFVVDILANFGASGLSSNGLSNETSPVESKIGSTGFKRIINMDLNSGSNSTNNNKQ